MAAHRYWRMNITANNGLAGGFVRINHVALAEQQYGPKVNGSATTTANSVNGSFAASNVNDNDRTTFWNTNSAGYPFLLTWDLGLGNDKDVQEIRITCDSSFPTAAPKDWKLQYSDDNATWFDQITVTSATTWSTTFFPNTYQTGGCPNTLSGYLIYRISSTASDGGNAFAQTEFELRPTIGGTDITSNTDCWASATSTFSGQPASQAIDNNTATWWSANGTQTASWYVELPYKQSVAQLAMIALSGGNQIFSSTTGSMSGSVDGVTFTTLISWSGQTGWTAGQTRTFNAAIASGRRRQLIVC